MPRFFRAGPNRGPDPVGNGAGPGRPITGEMPEVRPRAHPEPRSRLPTTHPEGEAMRETLIDLCAIGAICTSVFVLIMLAKGRK